jgi:SAM-dependent methyltransferase
VNCCAHRSGLEQEFDETTARRDLRRYRRRGPSRSTRLLLDAIRERGVDGASVLDIGGGVGTIHHELIEAGATGATHVDASRAYLEAARAEADRRAHGSRVRFVHADFVESAHAIGPADVVTLDRVICCYPDMEALVGRSAERAKRLYGVVFPREAWWLRPAFPLANGWFRLRRSPFRVFQHRPRDVDDATTTRGFRRVFTAATLLWNVWLFERVPSQP